MRVSTSQYVAYTRSYYGISVLIHSPEDYPQASSTTTVAQPGCDVMLAIIPSVVVSEPDVRSLTLKQRNCFFDDEVQIWPKKIFNLMALRVFFCFSEKVENY